MYLPILSIGNDIAGTIAGQISNAYLLGFVISMIPLVELRGGLPIAYGMLPNHTFGDLCAAWAVSLAGSCLVVPVLLACFLPIINWMKKTRVFKKFALWLENHFSKKSKKVEEKALKAGEKQSGETDQDNPENIENETATVEKVENGAVEDEAVLRRKKRIERSKYIALFAFTAIPLPLTGSYTASAVAAIMHLDFKKSLFWICLGNVVSATIIALVCFAGCKIID